MENESRWYMVRCATGKEEKAIETLKVELEYSKLDKYVEDLVCPKKKQFILRNDKKIVRKTNLLPGYIMMKAVMTPELPRLVRTTNLTVEIMSGTPGGKPKPLPEEEVNRIFGNIEKANDESNEEFIVGETVKVVDGPFNSFKGEITELKKGKVKLDVLVFGKPTSVELNVLQIEKDV
jgi:transcriptional antiterminator NusG